MNAQKIKNQIQSINKSMLEDFARTFVVILGILLAIDLPYLWLNYGFHKQSLEAVQCGQRMTVRMVPAVLSYLTGSFGLTLIAMPESPIPTRLKIPAGAALGFVAYGLYDTTNYATLAHYPLRMFLQDWAWGTSLYATVMFIWTRWVQ